MARLSDNVAYALLAGKKMPKKAPKKAPPKALTAKEQKFDRDMFHVLHATRDMTTKELAAKTGLSGSTIRNLFKTPQHGGTKKPQHFTVSRLANAAGLEYDLVPLGEKQYKETYTAGMGDNVKRFKKPLTKSSTKALSKR